MDIVKEINDCDNKIEKKEKTVTLENLIGKGSTICSLKENVKITDVEKVHAKDVLKTQMKNGYIISEIQEVKKNGN